MKAHEAIRKLKADRKEFLEEHGIKSHMSNISPELEAELFGDEKKIQTEQTGTETSDSAETIVVGDAPEKPPESPVEPLVEVEVIQDPPKEECPYTLAEIELGCRCLGGKAKQWKWRHLLNA